MRTERLTFFVTVSVLFAPAVGFCTKDERETRCQTLDALSQLYSISPAARHLGQTAAAVLIFPSIAESDSNVRAQQAYGTLFAGGTKSGYYKLVASSYRSPRGTPKFACALFFMSDGDLAELHKNSGQEIGIRTKTVNLKADYVVTIAPSATAIRGNASQVTHRPAMNDQQEAAPRPNGLTLDPKYGDYVPIATGATVRTAARTRPGKGVYAFVFGRRGLIRGFRLDAVKIKRIQSR
jgi:hypothetical protein